MLWMWLTGAAAVVCVISLVCAVVFTVMSMVRHGEGGDLHEHKAWSWTVFALSLVLFLAFAVLFVLSGVK